MLALALPGVASAHVTVEPATVTAGADALVTFTVPNEERSMAIVSFSVRLPEGFDAEAIQAKPGWRVARAGETVRWTGGAIGPGRFETFALTGSAPRSPKTLVFRAQEFLPGQVLTYSPRITVTGAGPARAAGRDSGARDLATAALIVAIVGAGAAVGAFFFALALWLRGTGRLSES